MTQTIGVIREDSAFSVMARIHAGGANLTQSDVSAIEYQIFPTNSTTAHTTATSLTVASVVFDALQTDDRWTEDATGYNFRHDVAATVLTDPSKQYEIEYKVTLTAGDVFYLKPILIVVDSVKSS